MKPVVRQQGGHVRLALLAAIVALALGFRVSALSAYGFSEDEVAKLRAVDAYRAGQFSANAEHPMLMKLAIWGSLSAADRWNSVAPPPLVLAPETALRLPNALAGTATVAVVYGIAAILFGAGVGLTAAFVVAVDPTVIALNRIGKEDTILVFFLLLAVLCYERAKVIGRHDVARAQPWYVVAGASFGLMLASKYLLHLLGLYALHNFAVGFHAGANRPRPLPYYAAMVTAFVAANFAIVLPSTWAYCFEYLRGGYSAHHGYLYDGQVYANSADTVVYGVPWPYYLQLLTTKVPLVTLAGALVGLGLLIRHRRERGFVWLRVFLVFLLLGYSLIGSKFQRYALPIIIVLDLVAAVGIVAVGRWMWARAAGTMWRVPAYALAGAAAWSLLAAPAGVAPFFSAYQNAIGAAMAPPLTVYPEEAYDFGVREAVAAIALTAAPGATIASDASLVVEQYLRQTRRRDLRARSLSEHGLGAGEQWVLVQDSHVYFENHEQIRMVRRRFAPWRRYAINGTPVLDVYRIGF